MRCPKCLSPNIYRYLTYLWKCGSCGIVFSAPEPDAIVAGTEGINDGAKDVQSAPDAADPITSK